MLQVIGAFLIFFKQVFPKTWTHFFSYSQFYKVVEFTRYQEKLPESAYDLRYYYYEGGFSDLSGYHAAFTEEDCKMMKENRLNKYDNPSPRKYLYDGTEKIYLDREQIKEMKIGYLDVFYLRTKVMTGFIFLHTIFRRSPTRFMNMMRCCVMMRRMRL